MTSRRSGVRIPHRPNFRTVDSCEGFKVNNQDQKISELEQRIAGLESLLKVVIEALPEASKQKVAGKVYAENAKLRHEVGSRG